MDVGMERVERERWKDGGKGGETEGMWLRLGVVADRS